MVKMQDTVVVTGTLAELLHIAYTLNSRCLLYLAQFAILLSIKPYMTSLQVLQHLNVFDESEIDSAAEALDDVIFHSNILVLSS